MSVDLRAIWESGKRLPMWEDEGPHRMFLYFGDAFCAEVYQRDGGEWRMHCHLTDNRTLFDSKEQGMQAAISLFWQEMNRASNAVVLALTEENKRLRETANGTKSAQSETCAKPE